MRDAFEKAIYELMQEDNRIVAMVADSWTGIYEKIKEEMPQRYIDVGIAENSLIGYASGVASEGLIPIVYAANNFLACRSYEFIRNDVCVDKRNVKIVGLGAGVVDNMQGPSHHSLEDIAALRVMPNLTLLSPGSPKEVKGALRAAVEHDGPVYIRLARAFETEIFEEEPPRFEIGKYNIVHEGKDVTLFATGSITGDACVAAKLLEKEDIGVKVVNVNSLKPMDVEGIRREAEETGKVITLEEHNIYGGLGGAVAEVLMKSKQKFVFEMMGFQDIFCNEFGWHQDLKRIYNLSPEHIAEMCRKVCKEEM